MFLPRYKKIQVGTSVLQYFAVGPLTCLMDKIIVDNNNHGNNKQ